MACSQPGTNPGTPCQLRTVAELIHVRALRHARRPGPIVGIEDHFYNYMVYNLSFGVIAPIVDDGAAKLQPTWVRDVADAVPAMLRRQETKGQTVYLAGPETLS